MFQRYTKYLLNIHMPSKRLLKGLGAQGYFSYYTAMCELTRCCILFMNMKAIIFKTLNNHWTLGVAK